MKQTSRKVAVAELKARLSEYLRRVRHGDEIIITDRGVPIARLSRLDDVAGFESMVAEGRARAPLKSLPADFWKAPRAKDPAGRLLETLLEERAEGR